jgi:hypothetical protein
MYKKILYLIPFLLIPFETHSSCSQAPSDNNDSLVVHFIYKDRSTDALGVISTHPKDAFPLREPAKITINSSFEDLYHFIRDNTPESAGVPLENFKDDLRRNNIVLPIVLPDFRTCDDLFGHKPSATIQNEYGFHHYDYIKNNWRWIGNKPVRVMFIVEQYYNEVSKGHEFSKNIIKHILDTQYSLTPSTLLPLLLPPSLK